MSSLVEKQIELEISTVEWLHEKMVARAIKLQKEAKVRKDASSLPQGIKFTQKIYREILTAIWHYSEAEQTKKRKSTFYTNVLKPSLAAYEAFLENKYLKGKFSHPFKLISWTVATQISGALLCPTGQKKVTSISREVVRVLKGTYSLGFDIDNDEIAGVTQFIRTYLTCSEHVHEEHMACKTVVVALNNEYVALMTDPETVHEMAALRIDKALAYKPMLVPPKHHRSLTDASGGYLGIASPLIKERNKHCDYTCPQSLLDKLNALQATPWEVNSGYMTWFKKVKVDHTHFDSSEWTAAYNLFARDVNPWIRQATTTLFEIRKERAALPESNVEKREYLLELCKVIEEDIDTLNIKKEEILSKTSKMDALNATMVLAKRFCRFKEFYLPLHIDDRCRVYTYCSALDFQGNKFAKSLIGTADRKRLSEEGVRELKIALGTCFLGYDKLKYDQRVAVVDEHLGLLFSMVENPTDEIFDILGKLVDEDEIFIVMRLSYELYRHTNDSTYVTGVLAYIDSCSSAIQIQALLQHDKKAADLTNITEAEGDKLSDAYLSVANACQHLVEMMSCDSDEDLLAKLTAFMVVNQSNRLQ